MSDKVFNIIIKIAKQGDADKTTVRALTRHQDSPCHKRCGRRGLCGCLLHGG